MNENVVDILIYLYENYMDSEQEAPSDHTQVHEELVQAGFPEQEAASLHRAEPRLPLVGELGQPRALPPEVLELGLHGSAPGLEV